MGNAIKHIKLHITNTPADMPEQQVRRPSVCKFARCFEQSVSSCLSHIPRICYVVSVQAKDRLLEAIDNFYHEKINLAGKAISKEARKKIKDGDVILVYAW